MSKLQNVIRLTPQASLLLAVILLAGCHQLSSRRAERVMDQHGGVPNSPSLGPSLGSGTTEFLPPPPLAPPAESARREPAADEFGWKDDAVADIDTDAEEFFPSSATELARDVMTERATEREARLAAEGRLATLRRAAQSSELPVIVPGTTLRRVSPQEPRLMPVPR